MRLLRRAYPALRWVVSFADGTQCGDGTIYRAAGFVLTKINSTSPTRRMPNGELVTRMTITKGRHILENNGRAVWPKGSIPLPGFQLRYIYFLDPTARERLTVPIIPFSEIEKRGAGMYLGKPRVRSVDSDTPGDQPGEGGATPTRTL